jgi:hypothetical protein
MNLQMRDGDSGLFVADEEPAKKFTLDEVSDDIHPKFFHIEMYDIDMLSMGFDGEGRVGGGDTSHQGQNMRIR